MENLQTVATDIKHDLEKPLEFCDKAAKVVASIVDSHAEIKQTLTDLVTKSEALGADITLDVSARGTNLLLDVQTGDDLLAYIQWIRSTLVPQIVATYGAIKADVTDAVPTA